jgi:hypothetical protein
MLKKSAHPCFRFQSPHSGRLLLECLVALCVCALFSVFIFQKQVQQQRQLEEVGMAEAIRTVQRAMKRYVENNWQVLAKTGGSIGGVSVSAPPAVPAKESAPGYAEAMAAAAAWSDAVEVPIYD